VDNVIPSAQVVQSTDGNGIITVTFRARDAENDLVTLEGFAYSDDGGSSWYSPTNGDNSGAFGGGWPNNGGSKFTSAADWSGTAHSFTFNTKHANVVSSHSLSSADISNFQVRFRVNDATVSSGDATSQDQILDNVVPSIDTAIHFETALVSGTSITLDAAFIETNPDANTFYYNLNATGYDAGTSGDGNVTVAAINGNDYFSAIKCTHVDDYGNTITTESVTNVYVKPYTPPAPTVNTPTVSTVNVTVNKHASEVTGLDYAIYVTPAVGGNNWVQADGSLGASALWWTTSEWGTKTVIGLSSPVSSGQEQKQR
jgi:hypothetical protein